jgi:hypothetical protein
MVRVLLANVDDHTNMLCVRHYAGSGSLIPLVELYATRKEKFLGRFQDDVWMPGKYEPAATEAEINQLRSAAKLLLETSNKLWK